MLRVQEAEKSSRCYGLRGIWSKLTNVADGDGVGGECIARRSFRYTYRGRATADRFSLTIPETYYSAETRAVPLRTILLHNINAELKRGRHNVIGNCMRT